MSEKIYNRLQKQSQLQALPMMQIKKNTLIMTLLNTRSLRKHLNDILMDKPLLCNDIIGLIETQLEVRENTADLKVKGFLRFFEVFEYFYDFHVNLFRIIVFSSSFLRKIMTCYLFGFIFVEQMITTTLYN